MNPALIGLMSRGLAGPILTPAVIAEAKLSVPASWCHWLDMAVASLPPLLDTPEVTLPQSLSPPFSLLNMPAAQVMVAVCFSVAIAIRLWVAAGTHLKVAAYHRQRAQLREG